MYIHKIHAPIYMCMHFLPNCMNKSRSLHKMGPKIMLESVYYTKGFEIQVLCAQM